MRLARQISMVASLAAVALLAGCRQDMHNQPKFIPQRGTTFYADGRSVRPQVENTVARGQLHEDEYFYTGLVAGKEGDMMPFPVTMQVLERGQERFNIYCAPCHSRVGNGQGMIVQRGYKVAANFHDAKRMAQPIGHYFNVMSHGYGSMPDYAAQVPVVDRWAIAAYIRALQLSQAAQASDVPAGQHVEKLSDIATDEGLPASFAGEWTLPATALSEMMNGSAAGAGSSTPVGPTMPKESTSNRATGKTGSGNAGQAVPPPASVPPSRQ